jgi:hypothetical protein
MYSESSKLLYAEIFKIAEAAIDDEVLFKESGIWGGIKRVGRKVWKVLTTPISFGEKPVVTVAKPVSRKASKIKSAPKVKKSKADIKKEKEMELFRRAIIEEASGGKKDKLPMWPFIVGGGVLFTAPIIYSLMKKKEPSEEYPFSYKTSALPEILAGIAIGGIPAYVLGSAKKNKEVARAHYLGYGSGLATGMAAPEVVKKIEKMQKILNVLEGEHNE